AARDAAARAGRRGAPRAPPEALDRGPDEARGAGRVRLGGCPVDQRPRPLDERRDAGRQRLAGARVDGERAIDGVTDAIDAHRVVTAAVGALARVECAGVAVVAVGVAP